MLSCPTKKYLGIECFGCGTQRALALVMQGKFVDAFHMFPAIYTLILFLGVVTLNFIDTKRNYSTLIISLATVNAAIMVISFFIKHPLF